jgi:dihydrodipicolinate synthase/N-acetylneuraminate lyase
VSTSEILRGDTVVAVLRGAIAAAVTPLAAGGAVVDADAFGPYVDFLAGHGLDGILALGTTGEGVLFEVDERRQIAELFVAAAAGRLQVAVHCGAQTTADTAALAAHAAEAGADAVAVIAPPYFAFDAEELEDHFTEAASACAPLPFYVYEFAARSGYAVPLEVLAALREEATNFVGLKVSDTPWDSFHPYLLEGLDIFVGPEALIPQGIAGGATGAVSGLAASFPDAVVPLVREPTPDRGERVGALRAAMQALPFHAASKAALGIRGVPVRGVVRRPLRTLHDDELDEVRRIVGEWDG